MLRVTKQWLVQCAYLLHSTIAMNILCQSVRCFWCNSPKSRCYILNYHKFRLLCISTGWVLSTTNKCGTAQSNFFPLWSCSSAFLPCQSKYQINRNGPCILDTKIPCKLVFVITLWLAENTPTNVHCWSRWRLYSSSPIRSLYLAFAWMYYIFVTKAQAWARIFVGYKSKSSVFHCVLDSTKIGGSISWMIKNGEVPIIFLTV